MGQVRGFHRCQLRACASTCSPFISCNTVSFFAQFVMSPDYVRTPASFRCVSRHYLPHGVAATVPRRTKNLVGYTARYRSTSFSHSTAAAAAYIWKRLVPLPGEPCIDLAPNIYASHRRYQFPLVRATLQLSNHSRHCAFASKLF
jgi:hypothetical protein